jgi:hypothetical protein
VKTITLTMQNPCGPEISGGQRGEHRMTELVIPLPQERLPEIKSCIAIFSCDSELMLSPLILPGESGDYYFADDLVHVTLWQRLTLCRTLRVQLECYADDQGKQFIARSEISERILFKKSLIGSLDEAPEVTDRPGAIEQLLAAMHRHGNMTVLEELGDAAGALTYKGSGVSTEPLTNMEINDLIDQALALL